MIDTVAAGAILYVISLAEGLRRLPDNAVILSRLDSRWRTVRQSAIGQRLHLVSWCLPVQVPLVLPPGDAPWTTPIAALREALHGRLARTRRQVVALRVNGFLTLALLVAGVPLAVEQSGVFGLVCSMALVEALCLFQGIVLWWALRRIGQSRSRATVEALSLLNPFAAQRGAELLYNGVVDGVPRDLVMWELLGETGYVLAQRSAIYDLLRTKLPKERYDRLTTLTGTARLEALLRMPGEGSGGNAFCPRCGAEYSAQVARCADCDDVPLVVPSTGSNSSVASTIAAR